MCGLVGAIKADGAFWTNINKFLWQGMYMNALRGMGGCGIGLVFKDFTTEYAKTHNSAPAFLYSDEWEWVEKNLVDTRAILGHTRSATLGKVATSNSHPFRFKDANNEVLMIHNGHVSNHMSLTPASFKHDVDSAHVAYSLFSKGALATLELLQGAYTLIWFDKKNSAMHMARNEERSLYYVQDKLKEHLYFSSELDMLASIVRRNSIPHINSFHELEPETLYTFDLREKTLAPTKTKYEQKKFQPAYQSNNGNGYGGQKDWAQFKNYTKQPASTYIGDYIWCTVADPDDTALILYKPIGDGEGQVAAANAYGYVYGTRSMDYGSIVRVNGIGYQEWNSEGLNLIKSLIPVRITKVEKGLKNAHTGLEYTSYEGTVDREESVKDIRQAKIAKKRQQVIKDQRERYEADLAAGRILPRTVISDPKKADGGSGGDGVGVGPPNRDSAEGLGLDNTSDYPPIAPVYVPGPKGRRILMREWKDIANQGCFFCQGKFDIQVDAGKVEWWEHPRNPEDRKDDDAEWQMICIACQDDPHKMEAIAAA